MSRQVDGSHGQAGGLLDSGRPSNNHSQYDHLQPDGSLGRRAVLRVVAEGPALTETNRNDLSSPIPRWCNIFGGKEADEVLGFLREAVLREGFTVLS
jgi:hypothetical protein